MFKKICLSILAVLMCLSVTGNKLFADDDPIEAQYFETNSLYEVLKVGESKALNPVVYPENATGYSLEYDVENGGVVSVSADGVVTGLAEGYDNVIITLKDSQGGMVYSATVGFDVKAEGKHYLVEYYVSSNDEMNMCGLSWDQPVGAVIDFREPWATKATKITVNGVEVSGSSYTITGDEEGDTITVVHYVPYLGNAYGVTGNDTYVLGIDGNYDFFTENSDFLSVQLDGDAVDYSSESWQNDWYLPDYVVSGLALGNHTVKVNYYDGYGEKVFTVISPESMEWNDPEYVWTDDNSSVTATIVCATDSSIVITETVNTIKTVLTPSTCAVAGLARYTANFENSLFTSQIKEVELPLAEHTYAFGGWNWVDGDPVTATGRFECSVCGDEKVVDAVVTIDSDTSSCEAAGVIRYKGDVHLGELAEIGYHDVETEPLGHSWIASWEWKDDYSEATLTLECERCGEKDTYTVEPDVTTENATCEAAGSITYYAYIEIGDEAYDDTRSVDLPQLEHVYSYEGIEWNGWKAKAHYTCDNCHGDFYVECEVLTTADKPASCTEPGEKTVVATVEEADSLDGAKHQDTKHEDYEALGHLAGETVKENVVEPTCEDDGSHQDVVYCERCHEEISRVDVVDKALGHDYGEWIVDTPATCTEAGSQHRVCSRNEEHVETEVIKALGHQEAEPVKENVIEATCEEAGSHDEVVYCDHCHEELSREHVVDKALGHDWEITYEWADDFSKVTGKRVCKNDASHKSEETVETSYRLAKESTCVEKGKGVYVAVFTNDFFGIQIKEVELPLADHKYVFDHMEWAEDNTSAEAIYKCSVCEDVVKVVAEVSSEITKEATCEERGLRVITALVKAENSIDGFEHKDTKEEELAKLMHVWQLKEWQWADDYSSAKAVFECVVNPETTMSTDAHVAVEEDDEKFTYKAVAIVDGKEYFDTKSVEKPFEYKLLEFPKEYVLGSKSEMKWHTNGDLSKLLYIELDGEVVSEDMGELTEGSTIFVLKTSVLEGLKTGEHEIKFVYEDGELMTRFTVKKAQSGDSGVPTGDVSNLLFWSTTLASSLAGVYVLAKKKKED